MKNKFKYRRIILKLSGEVFLEPQNLSHLTTELKDVYKSGIRLGIVVGGGNILRGANAGFLDRIPADYVGILGTAINSIILENILRKAGLKVLLQSSIEIEKILKKYSYQEIMDALKANYIVIFAAGSGQPYITTDTTAALKAVEIKAEAILKATKVDGVYSNDPQKNPKAEKFVSLTYQESIEKNLKIMDITAFSILKEHKIPTIVFNFYKKGNIFKILKGEKIGTIIR